MAAAVAIGVGFGLYGFGSHNWVITLRNTYREVSLPMGKRAASAVLALPTAVVSPGGEEFFFWRLFHFPLKRVAGNGTAMLANAFAFGSVHLLHHGIVRDAAALINRGAAVLTHAAPWIGGACIPMLCIGLTARAARSEPQT